jgi:guanosine-3',5'-bis(diphosphate) 3'-pyrophosphohydrolase
MNTTPRDDISLLLTAIAFAADKHRNQRRKDIHASPYINHPIALANVLKNEGGIADAAVLSAALLHDTVEDTDATREELESVFGREIAAIVLEVTDDMTLPRGERKRLQVERAATISHRAKLVKLADKICNLRDLLKSQPAEWTEERTSEYFDWARAVVDGLRGTNAALERIFDGLYAERAIAGKS